MRFWEEGYIYNIYIPAEKDKWSLATLRCFGK